MIMHALILYYAMYPYKLLCINFVCKHTHYNDNSN